MAGIGETMRLDCTFCKSMYSSNEKVIFLPEKFIEESPGTALTSFGGIESLGPPDGGMILAQPEPPDKIKIIAVNNNTDSIVPL